MSQTRLEQAKELTATLSPVEKAQLIEWLGAAVVQELTAETGHHQVNGGTVADAGLSPAATAAPPEDERPWTAEEIQDLMQPNPKTGAEIAAWLEANPDTGGWAELDIPDVVEWVRQLRRQQRPEALWDK